MAIKRRYRWLAFLTVAICLMLQLGFSPTSLSDLPQPVPQPDTPQAQTLSQTLYEAGELNAALLQLQQEAQAYQQQLQQSASWLGLAAVQSNLALVYQQLGQWPAANQAINESQRWLAQAEAPPDLQAQVLNVRGRLELAQGQAEAALASWEQAADLYRQAKNSTGEQQSQLNQAQALQALGLYRRAVTLLTELNAGLNTGGLGQPLLKAIVLRSLGEALQVAGDLAQSRQALEQALQILPADDLDQLDNRLTEARAATQIALANLTRIEATTQLSRSNLSVEAISGLEKPPAQNLSAQNLPAQSLTAVALHQRQTTAARQFKAQVETALQLYRAASQAANQAASPAGMLTQTQARLGLVNALIELHQEAEAVALIPALDAQIAVLPVSQTSLSQRINLGLAQLRLKQLSPDLPAALTQTIQQAAQLQDRRTQSFGLGVLGQVYQTQNEQTQDWTLARQTTQQALMLAQSIGATDLAYRWQWQLGRLLNQQGDRSGAIAAYTEAVKGLQALRNDLVAINREAQFSFQSQVEPVYRELVDLLLTEAGAVPSAQLTQARDVIEGLQVAELDNFFREACLETEQEIDQVVDQDNLSAAVFYTIVLPDRIEVILKLPQQELSRYRVLINQADVNQTVEELLDQLKLPYISQRSKLLSQQVYQWLLAPAAPLLRQHQTETLVFVLDGALRNLPLTALFDGQNYVVEQYSVALAPGLKLVAPKSGLPKRQALVAGLSESRASFAPLNFVAQEVETIQTEIPSKLLFNQSFTEANFQKQLDQSEFAVVHIATHGQFSSNAAETFILAWDRPINVTQLGELLQTEATRREPIELLVLSACQTAVGDRRATLGMAGVSVRAGARSTIASLWNLEDDSGAVLMAEFYKALTQAPISKAEALRQAQVAILQNPQYQAPRFWAPYVLLGNWL